MGFFGRFSDWDFLGFPFFVFRSLGEMDPVLVTDSLLIVLCLASLTGLSVFTILSQRACRTGGFSSSSLVENLVWTVSLESSSATSMTSKEDGTFFRCLIGLWKLLKLEYRCDGLP